jgi:hypothetical protein
MSVKRERELEEDLFISDDNEEEGGFTDTTNLYKQDIMNPDTEVKKAHETIVKLATDISIKLRIPDSEREIYLLPPFDAPLNQEGFIKNFVLALPEF